MLSLCIFILFIGILEGAKTNNAKTKPDHDNDDNENTKPNIILLVMDDLGFNDVPWHDHSNTQMPFLEQFVEEQALKIDTFYAMPLCSMTRSALLTGRYTMRYGLQSSVVENGFPFGLSVHENILAQDFKKQGYSTYMIGKWHLGFHRPDMTPLHRGFEQFHGSLSPMLHYFNYAYTVNNNGRDYTGYDLWINEEQISMEDTDKRYLTHWEGDQFIDLLDEIVDKDPLGERPFFMYVAMHASHDPREATEACLDLYYETECIDRGFEQFMNCGMHQVMQAQSSCADQTQQRMIKHLQSINGGKVWDNTLLIWLSDNGAPPWDGDNSPLRGAKKELYEGGVRTPAFVSGGYLNSDRYGQVFDTHTPFHVTDWYPTLLAAAGIEYKGTKPLDGYNQWDAIQNDVIAEDIHGSNREFLYNVDPKDCETVMCGAYRYGPWKFIWSQNTAPDQMYWFDYYSTNPRKTDDGKINPEYSNYLNCGPIPDGVQTSNHLGEHGEFVGKLPCGDKPCIFNIEHDPCEYNDLSSEVKYENLYLYMYNMLMAYYESQQLSLRKYYDDKFDFNADPKLNDGYWKPWMRSYNHDDDITDFEDVMRLHYTYDSSQDITLSQYHPLAMKFKQKWDEQVLNGLLADDENMIPIDQIIWESPYDDIFGNKSMDKKHFKVLMIVTVSVGLVIIVGFIALMFRWYHTCCQIRQSVRNSNNRLRRQKMMDAEDEYEYDIINDTSSYVSTATVEQAIRVCNHHRPTYHGITTLENDSTGHSNSIDVNDVIDDVIEDMIDVQMPLLKKNNV